MMSEKDKNNEQLIEVFRDFDEMIEVNIPSIEQLKTTITQHETKQRKAFYRELVLFIFTACIVLTTLMTVLVELPIIFIVVQLILLCFMPFMFKLERRHHEEEELYS